MELLNIIIPMISKDRSRDMSYFGTLGATIKSICNNEKGLEIWKSCCINEVKQLCDEYWNLLPDNISTLKVSDILSIEDIENHNFDKLRSIGYMNHGLNKELDPETIYESYVTNRNVFKYAKSCDINMLLYWSKTDSPDQYYKNISYGNIPYHQSDLYNRAIKSYTSVNRESILSNMIIINEKELFSEHIPFDRDIYLIGAMGTGKTNAIYYHIENCESYLVISNKCIQAKKYKDMFTNSTLYKETDNWTKSNKLIVELESLRYVSKYDYDVLLIDEVESIWRLLISKTLTGKELETLSTFLLLLHRCKRIIVMDAFLKEDTVKFLIEKRKNIPYHIIINEFKQVERSGERICRMYNKKSEWIGDLINDKRRKVIPCLSKKMADDIYQTLENIGQKTLLITKDTPNSIKYMNPDDNWSSYHNIVYTPSLSNSISFTKEHFDVLYVYGNNGSCGPEDLIQMMGRVRDIKDKYINVYIESKYTKIKIDSDICNKMISFKRLGKCNTFSPVSKEIVYKYMETGRDVFNKYSDVPFLASQWMTTDESIKDLYARLYVDRTLGQLCFKSIFIHILENQMGYKIEKKYNGLNTGSLDKKGTVINRIDKQVYNSYVLQSYPLYEKTYTLWTKGKHDEIKKIANMARGIDINMKNDVFKLFELGGTRINTISDLKSTEVILRYTTRDRDKLEPICKRLAMYYGITVDRAFWKWIGKLFGDKLLINGSQLPDVSKNSVTTYQYKLHIADWLYWFIKIDPPSSLNTEINTIYNK